MIAHTWQAKTYFLRLVLLQSMCAFYFPTGGRAGATSPLRIPQPSLLQKLGSTFFVAKKICLGEPPRKAVGTLEWYQQPTEQALSTHVLIFSSEIFPSLPSNKQRGSSFNIRTMDETARGQSNVSNQFNGMIVISGWWPEAENSSLLIRLSQRSTVDF